MNRSRDYLRDAVAVGLLCLGVIIFTWRIALAGRVLASGDVFTYFYPYWAAATRAIRAGRLPLWNPSLFMGVPFAANSQAGLFYPLNWLVWLLLPAHRSVHVTIVLHLCLAALNAYLWGRSSLRLGWVGAWTVGALFALGGYLGVQVEHINQLQGLAWFPLMLMLTDRVVHPQPSDQGSAPGCPSRSHAGREGRRRPASIAWYVPFLWTRLMAACALAVVIGLLLLAGHTQTAFISLFGVGVYGLLPLVTESVRSGDWRPTIEGAALLGVGASLGMILAAVQLLPTWQLSQLSVRALGLPFNERVSFSLSPLYVGRALLPVFEGAIPPGHLEHVAYIGVTGLALTSVGLVTNHSWASRTCREERGSGSDVHRSVLALVLLGLLFALGLYNPLYVLLARYVPGFAHFRVPARWLALYACGAAALAGRAVQAFWQGRSPDRRCVVIVAGSLAALALWAVIGGWLASGPSNEGGFDLLSVSGWVTAIAGSTGLLLIVSKSPRVATIGLLLLLVGELFLARRALPRARATAPQAFTSVRPAIAHLLASEISDGQPRGRFLSMSDTTFDPGDLSLIKRIYGPQLSSDQLYDYIVATKQKEVLSPNLPLAFGVPAVDGYDGGLLPLQRYVTLQRAFLSSGETSIDGRLRENLAAIPEGRWLNLFNVRYIITDKLQDAWIDDVFYDLQFGASLSDGEKISVAEVPRFEATALGLISHLEPPASQPSGTPLPPGAPVGLVRVGFPDGAVQSFELRAGEHVPDSTHDGQASAATRLRWAGPARPLSVTVEAMIPDRTWRVRGMSLIDERTGAFQSLVVSDRGRLRLVHSGDVKIYENLDRLPRAFIVPQAQFIDDDEAALRAMEDPAFDLSSRVLLTDGPLAGGSRHVLQDTVQSADGSSSASALVRTYRAERVIIDAELDSPGYLVLTDAHYPGWQATVGGEPVPIYRADLLFRAVALPPGEHRVIFTFRPVLHRVGVAVSLLGCVVLVVIWRARVYVSRMG